jgi:tetratricopeptide (TPR) repeat protein
VHLRPRAGTSFDDYAAEIATLIKRPRAKGAAGDYPDTVYAAFVKSLEALKSMDRGETALDLLRLCAFLSPDGVDLGLLLNDESGEILPASFARAMTDKYTREDALAALVSLSLLRQDKGPVGLILIFHRLLLDVVRDWVGADARDMWGSAAVQLVSRTFPFEPDAPSTWPLCARLMPHFVPLDAHAPRTGAGGQTLGRLLNQGCVYLSARGDRAGALALAKRAVEFGRSTNVQPLNLAAGLGNLAGRYADLDRLDEAEMTYREALAIKEPLLKPDDPSLAITLSNLAEVHWKRRQFAEAEPLFFRTVEIMKAARGDESAEYGLSLSNLGMLYGEWANEPDQAGKREQEQQYKTQGLAVSRAARGARHPQLATHHNNAAVMNAQRGDWAGAATEMERALAIMLSLDLAEHPQTQSSARALVDYWRHCNQSDKAARLEGDDISDLLPVIAQIETEHRAWVAEDPKKRHFGPPSPFAKK